MNRLTSTKSARRELIALLGFIAWVSGCRQLAGYDATSFFDDEHDGAAQEGGGTPAADGGGIEDAASLEDVAVEGGTTNANARDATAEVTDQQAPLVDVANLDVVDAGGAESSVLDSGRADPDAAAEGGASPDAAAEGGASPDTGTAPNADSSSDEDAARDAHEDALVSGGDGGYCDPMAPQTGTNVIANHDFESTDTPGAGWSAPYGGTFSVVSTYAHCGSHSGAVTSRNQFFHAGAYAVTLAENTSFSYSAWVLQDGDTNISMAFQWFSSNSACENSGFGPVSFATVPPKTWTQLKGVSSVSPHCTTQYVYIVQQQPTQTGDGGITYPNLYIDDVYVTQ